MSNLLRDRALASRPESLLARAATGAHGIRRGCSLANSAGTYEFAREHPAAPCAPHVPIATHIARAARRPAALLARFQMRCAGGAA